ncbi:DUF5916 domain-containing protein [Flavobacterium muglaense]|uniref:Carbohydrate binding family 9 domain-containing protein n=1 Tax=Flavobacterium muglaense TaxID=2764716 RepID=A0A923MZV3_9FLAO|nr:DUF5916 domain-containing protein [Flavobacterium muglaense]MBC5838900.1 carbohydrate binding family 9 domain-containing protein [Flavobacterium muglaense]MBC5845403.1 carbohydrate binding family 9 domain-containing protein [Flavobacterium muglaense]
MPTSSRFVVVALLFISFSSYCQKKELLAQPTKYNITIDGKVSEDEWLQNPNTATDFVMYQPDNGKPINKDKQTDVKVLYNNDAIYISAILNDNEPSKIRREITNRDVFGVSDHFSVSINGFNDGQQDFRFYVSAAGVQMDCIATEGSEDFSWDAIWDSSVKITDTGWIVEMKIPYAALRFSGAPTQTWGLNFMREIKRDAQKYTWNYIDTKIGNEITQAGLLKGIENIKPPIRLFFIPYVSGYYQEDKLASDRTVKAGLDIKYGINDSFTLDAILVPDFGQTKFDNAILNLEPFEQRLDENRPFFTEGTNLFNIGNLFYSRRIGGAPSTYPSTATNEEVTNYPSSANLINAVKISGRTEKGLGIGFLNALTKRTFATILNTDTEESRKELIEPMANYNIIVLDQRFNQNSSVSFVNTNTTRNGSFRDANVAALVFDLSTKTNSYNLYGDFKYSTINDVVDYNGYKTSLNFAKTRGKYRYLLSGKYISENYDVNDLGIIFYTNYHNAYANGSYRILNPTKYFNTFKVEQELNLEIQNTTGKFQEAWYKTLFKATTKNNHYLEFSIVATPVETFDFYEPRVGGSYVQVPRRISSYFGVEFNANSPFTFDFTPSIVAYDQKNRITYGIAVGPKYRFNDKLSLSYILDYSNRKNDRGWVGFTSDDIIFGQRDREILQNDITGKYAINNKMTVNLTARYYWSYSENHNFLTLQQDGYLTPNTTYTLNKDRNFNSWNFDLAYSWWFAPGSEMSVLYRNYSLERGTTVEKNLNTNFKSAFNGNLTNILSISFRYFIDYNRVKNKF